jgi:hypothetical protein
MDGLGRGRVYAAIAKPTFLLNCNAAIIVQDDVVVVDAKSIPSAARQVISAIKHITDKPVTTELKNLKMAASGVDAAKRYLVAEDQVPDKLGTSNLQRIRSPPGMPVRT